MNYCSTGQTLRWGTSQFGRAVGNFFGVTEASQHGTSDTIGWEQVSGIRAEVSVCVCVCVGGGGGCVGGGVCDLRGGEWNHHR